MTNGEHDPFEQQIAAWMASEAQNEPDEFRALPGALRQTRRMPQQRRWVWSFPPMPRGTREVGVAFALICVVASAVILGPLSRSTASIAGPSPSVTSTASPRPLIDLAYTPVANLSTPRSQLTATMLTNGLVLIVGGLGENLNFLSSAELFNPQTATFEQIGSMSISRISASAMLLNDGRVLIAGGQVEASGQSEAVYTASAEIYDPSSKTFTATGSMHLPRGNAVAVLLSDGRVLIAGGFSQGNVTSAAEIFDPATGTFVVTGSMSESRGAPTGTRLTDGEVLVTGGRTNVGSGQDMTRDHVLLSTQKSTNSAEIFNPLTGTFHSAGPMSMPREGHTASLLPDGRVLVVGGQAFASADAVQTADVFDPRQGQFIATGTPIGGHTLGTATVLPDGRVLIIGDFASARSPFAEIYDERDNSFHETELTTLARTSPVTSYRFWHTATLLPDGDVLLAGGFSHGDPGGPLQLAGLLRVAP